MRDVAVIGIGMTKFGELWNKNLRELFVEAALKAIKDAGVDHIDSMYVGCMTSGLFAQQEHIAALMADYLGQKHVPAYRVESACASGGLAFRLGFIEVASGMSDIVLVGGVEKMHTGADATACLAAAADAEYESFLGITFPGLYAMIANAYREKYNIPFDKFRKQLAMVAVKNHDHGSRNPNAQFPMKITIDTVLNSTLVADPLRLFDCSPVTDGAAAVILCPVELAKKYTDTIIKVAGSGAATSTIALAQRDDMTWLDVVEKAAERAYKMAGVTPKDIDFAEVHDCFTIAEICVTEALGFFEPGKGAEAVEAGKTSLDGEIPINTSGGLKSKGHPVGATGVAQICELVEQLRGTAGERQVKNARRGLAQNMGGSGASSTVHILEVL
ncbi:acetyl-CoA C-acetyltransferase [Thermosulfidibacter takaii ABI70S6]|uniref:Acetyl-CoA C-acetyltransferase n=1 Tax=Thermosulfidibacter takaii (strain DSM 17441 / JCM 13301 / NBRC 103674 / ABI70S6) TaxID=1298851 RepID=A0A0S3QVK3_THET7|nr:thiolase domain-containing protein [Thermosulfidibacter takaii]BAT72364.1 acetyl-CoA C-acetyltransferase [Thermosulfidibacter takaii ABI70S6]